MNATPPAPGNAPAQPAAQPAAGKTYSALAAAGNATVVGVPAATIITWALVTYVKPAGAPLPDWVAAAIGTAIGTWVTYVYHVGSVLFQKWVNAKLDS